MRLVLFIIGWLSFVLGVIGAFLPVLPTTPFLILSAYLFSKSSPRFYAWLLALPWAGPAILDWQSRRVVRPRAKIMCAVMITISCVTIWLSTGIPLPVQIFVSLTLVLVGSFVVTRASA